MTGKLIGFNRFTSKKGTPTCIALMERDLTDYEKKNGYYGTKTVENVGLYGEYYELLQDADCGKNFEYNFGSRGFLQSFFMTK